MINKSIPDIIEKIKNPSLKLFSFIYRHPLISGIVILFIILVLTNLYDTTNFNYRHPLIFGISALLIFLAYREYHKEEFIIEPFEVPEYLQKNGLTGKAIAYKITDKINYIKQVATTSMEATQFSTKSVDPLPEIVVPGTGISFRPFIRYIKSEFSPYKPKIVSGELFVDNDFLYLTTRVLGSPEKTFAPVKKENLMKVPDSNKIGDFDNLMLQAAIHIYRYTQPYILASYYYSLKKPDDAMEIVKEIVRDKNNANKVWAYNLWGVMLADQKKYDEAIKMFNIALDEDSESVLVYNNLGNVYSDEGDYNEAKKYYEKAIDLDPQYSPSYNNLGIVYSDEGHYNEAKESYEKAIDLDPQYTLAYNNLGNVYSNVDYDKRDGSKAKEYYEKALDLDPQYSYAYNNLGIVYSAEGDYSKAKELYNKAIELDSTYSNAYYSLGNVYSAEKDYSKAKDMYEKVIEIDPDGFGKQARGKIENLPN